MSLTPEDIKELRRLLSESPLLRLSYDDGITDDRSDPPEQGKPAALYGPGGEWVADFDCGMLPKAEADALGRLLAAINNAAPALLTAAEEREALHRFLRMAAKPADELHPDDPEIPAAISGVSSQTMALLSAYVGAWRRELQGAIREANTAQADLATLRLELEAKAALVEGLRGTVGGLRGALTDEQQRREAAEDFITDIPAMLDGRIDVSGEWSGGIPEMGLALDAIRAVRRERDELAWYIDRHGTRAETEAEDAAMEADLAAVDALTDEQVAAMNEAEGIDSPAQRQRFDVFLRVLTRETVTRAKLVDVTAERDELRATLDNERGLGSGPSEGWRYNAGAWVHPDATVSFVLATALDGATRRRWEWSTIDKAGQRDTAREAMRAADTALAGAKS